MLHFIPVIGSVALYLIGNLNVRKLSNYVGILSVLFLIYYIFRSQWRKIFGYVWLEQAVIVHLTVTCVCVNRYQFAIHMSDDKSKL